MVSKNMNTNSHDTLRFSFTEEKPELHDTTIQNTIYTSKTVEFFGQTFVFNIIGSSHYIYCKDIPYYEISSCKSVNASNVHSIELTKDFSLQFTFESPKIQAETQLKTYDLSEFDTTKTYDLIYKFAEDAYTAIDIRDTSYVTWHTYPEFNLALFTETNFLSK